MTTNDLVLWLDERIGQNATAALTADDDAVILEWNDALRGLEEDTDPELALAPDEIPAGMYKIGPVTVDVGTYPEASSAVHSEEYEEGIFFDVLEIEIAPQVILSMAFERDESVRGQE